MNLRQIYNIVHSGLLEKHVDEKIKTPLEKIEVKRVNFIGGTDPTIVDAYPKYNFYLAYDSLKNRLKNEIVNMFVNDDESLFYDDYYLKLTDMSGEAHFILYSHEVTNEY